MNVDRQTIATYDNSAEKIASHFKKYSDGAATKEIEKVFELVNKQGKKVNKVVEIGCGAGKEAEAIATRAIKYEGLDPSGKLLEIARKIQIPNASFIQTDALSYNYPPETDVVFAFASLLHLDEDDFAETCQKVANSLKEGGVLCMTLKENNIYKEIMQEDKFGKRLFYLYSPDHVKKLVGSQFKVVYESHSTVGPQAKKWMSLIFVKNV